MFVRITRNGATIERVGLTFAKVKGLLDSLLVNALEGCDDVLWHTRCESGSDSIEIILVRQHETEYELEILDLDFRQSAELDEMIWAFHWLIRRAS